MEEQIKNSCENELLVQRLQLSGVIKTPSVISAMLATDRGNYTKVNLLFFLASFDEIMDFASGKTWSIPGRSTRNRVRTRNMFSSDIRSYPRIYCCKTYFFMYFYFYFIFCVKEHLSGEHPSILVVGSGSGYLCSMIGCLIPNGGNVYGLERIKGLADRSISNIMRDQPRFPGTKRVVIEHGNGWDGNPVHAPYDVAVVCAAAAFVPQSVVDQLRTGGVLVIPLWNSTDRVQWLCKMEKLIDGTCTMEKIMPVL